MVKNQIFKPWKSVRWVHVCQIFCKKSTCNCQQVSDSRRIRECTPFQSDDADFLMQKSQISPMVLCGLICQSPAGHGRKQVVQRFSARVQVVQPDGQFV